jgi:tRNA G18 (ribose-2'-O)-methylase SpoU
MTPEPRIISSDDNPVFKDLKKVLGGRGIRKHGRALVSGARLVSEFLERSPERCEAWISTARQGGPPPRLPSGASWYQLSGSLFRDVDVVGTDSPMLLVAVPSIPAWDVAAGFRSGCTLLVPFQDPENVGAVIRSAVAFGVETVVLLEESAHPYHPRSLRASAGAVFRVRLESGPSLADIPVELPVVALSPDGSDIGTVDFPSAFGLLPGVEGPGLPEKFRARSLSIPATGDIDSLNAAAATAIALYLWSRSRPG